MHIFIAELHPKTVLERIKKQNSRIQMDLTNGKLLIKDFIMQIE